MNSEQTKKTANLLTVCIKAGKTVLGFDAAVEAVKSKNAYCVLTAGGKNSEGSSVFLRKIRNTGYPDGYFKIRNVCVYRKNNRSYRRV